MGCCSVLLVLVLVLMLALSSLDSARSYVYEVR